MNRLMNFLRRFLLIDIFKGLKVTGKHFFKKPITINYPEEKTPRAARFRGLHALRRYDSGEERCIGCKLCESVCPSLAITMETEPDKNDDSRRITTRYEIDLFKCIYCGLCEQACPVDAIVETRLFEYHFDKNNQRIINKDQLLNIGDKHKDLISDDLMARRN